MQALAQAAQRQVGFLRQEQHAAFGGIADLTLGIRPQPSQGAQQGGLATTGRPLDQH